MANSIDPDYTARNEPSYLNLKCLHGYLFWFVGLKGLTDSECPIVVALLLPKLPTRYTKSIYSLLDIG